MPVGLTDEGGMRLAFAPILLVAVTAPAAAQEPEPPRRLSAIERLESLFAEPGSERDEIETDRDSFTPASTLVGRRRLVAESAYSFVDNRGIKETHSFPELLIRYGITDRFEARLGWNYEVGGVGNATTGADAGDEDPNRSRTSLIRERSIAYGFKVAITEQDRWRPRTAAILQGFTPTGGPDTATQMILTGIAGWEFANRWKFDTAFRYGTESEEGDRFNQWAPSAVVKVPIGEKWAAHAEYFGIFTTGSERNVTKHFFSPGLHYLVTPDFEVGFRVGWGLNDQSARFFSNIGIGARF